MPVFEVKVKGTVEMDGVFKIIAQTHKEAKELLVKEIGKQRLGLTIHSWPDGLEMVKVTKKRHR